MAVPIEEASVARDRIISGLSRYRKQTPIYYGEQRILTFDTYLRAPYVVSGDEKSMVITKGVEYRPDLVSYDVYGSPDLWWKILEVNGMFDIMDFETGRTIILPEEFI